MKLTAPLFVIFALSLMLVSCSLSNEEISATVKSSMQQTLNTDPTFKDYKLTVTEVQVIKKGGNEYAGIAKVKKGNTTHDISTRITVDGRNVLWEVPPGGFLSILLSEDTSSMISSNDPKDRTTQKETATKQRVETKPDPMVLVQGGTFQMGSSDGGADEKPVHEVTVSDFYIGRYEVTVQEWYDFLKALDKKDFEKAKKFTTSAVIYDSDGNLQMTSTKFIDDASCAVNEISWYAAVEFCNWKSEKEGLQKAYTINGDKVTCDFNANGYRLPTEAEWEYAARGGNKSEGYKYSGGSNYLKVAWMSENSGNKVHPVGTKEPNELGIYDMSGNLYEWCWDWYNENYYKNSPKENPKGTTNGSSRVQRGGGWYVDAGYCRVASRYDGGYPGYGYYDFGFRLAKTK